MKCPITKEECTEDCAFYLAENDARLLDYSCVLAAYLYAKALEARGIEG
jgi:hypothetical protein